MKRKTRMNNLTFNDTVIINYTMQRYQQKNPTASIDRYNKYLRRVVNRILKERNK